MHRSFFKLLDCGGGVFFSFTWKVTIESFLGNGNVWFVQIHQANVDMHLTMYLLSSPDYLQSHRHTSLPWKLQGHPLWFLFFPCVIFDQANLMMWRLFSQGQGTGDSLPRILLLGKDDWRMAVYLTGKLFLSLLLIHQLGLWSSVLEVTKNYLSLLPLCLFQEQAVCACYSHSDASLLSIRGIKKDQLYLM